MDKLAHYLSRLLEHSMMQDVLARVVCKAQYIVVSKIFGAIQAENEAGYVLMALAHSLDEWRLVVRITYLESLAENGALRILGLSVQVDFEH